MIDLDQFSGTEAYHYLNFLKNLKFTDGFKYLAEELKCFWLCDILASVQHLKEIKDNSNFILWSIKVKDSKAIVTARPDTDGEILYKQELEYTDFPEDFEFYQINDVVLLKGEY